MSNKDESWLWHRRIAHIHMDHLNNLVLKDLIDGLEDLHLENNGICDAVQKGSQVRAPFKAKKIVFEDRPL